MGRGRFSDDHYVASKRIRASKGIDDFAYTQQATKIHDSLDPKRILTKPFKKLESRDSVEHPISTPIIVTFDVTGSNYHNAKIAQKKLPELMAKLTAVCENPQVAIWANDDTTAVGHNALQLGEFESDNRIDDTIRNIWLTRAGGGNDGESYDLLVFAAARYTVTDSYEKRGKKGYMVLYADEPFFEQVSCTDVNEIFGGNCQADIPIASIIAEAQQKWEIYVVWPQDGFKHARDQYVTLFGDDHVLDLQDPALLCDRVASIVAAHETAMEEIGHAALVEDMNDIHDRVV